MNKIFFKVQLIFKHKYDIAYLQGKGGRECLSFLSDQQKKLSHIIEIYSYWLSYIIIVFVSILVTVDLPVDVNLRHACMFGGFDT